MNIALIAFSERGLLLARRVEAGLLASGHETIGFVAGRHAEETPFAPFASVRTLVEKLFPVADALVFIGACGIAARAVAPHIKSKLKDPAVVVCDETGQFAISLLSGHAGGANALAAQVAANIGAVPVITTASDAHAALEGAQAPKNVVIGVGCRRGIPAEAIERAVTILLWDQNIPLARVCEVATIDIKRDEEGLVLFAKAHKLPLFFFSSEALSAVPGEFSASARVLEAVGVDNVCERAAVRCGGKGRLILPKATRDGVTVAAFERE